MMLLEVRRIRSLLGMQGLLNDRLTLKALLPEGQSWQIYRRAREAEAGALNATD